MHEPDDRRLQRALARYQVVSAYIALDPPRGQRSAVRERLAARIWRDADGAPMHVSAETVRAWVRRYRAGGLKALEDKPRPRPGVRVLPSAVIELALAAKREVPERSLDRIIRILEQTGQVEPGLVRRSTLHRV